jgi:hypothetical protein
MVSWGEFELFRIGKITKGRLKISRLDGRAGSSPSLGKLVILLVTNFYLFTLQVERYYLSSRTIIPNVLRSTSSSMIQQRYNLSRLFTSQTIVNAFSAPANVDKTGLTQSAKMLGQ